jgi:hypothetical protein
MSRRVLCSVAGAVLAVLAVTGCDVASPDPAACKAAIQAELLKAGPGITELSVPKACKGLPKSEVELFMRQVLLGR